MLGQAGASWSKGELTYASEYTNGWYKGVVMALNTSIVLSDHLAQFAQQQVREGRYGSTSDVLRAGLRLLEERETKIASLRQALIKGEQSGPPRPFDFDAFIARKRETASQNGK